MIIVKCEVTENYLPNQAIVKQLAKCQFPTTKYYDYERKAIVDYPCESKEEDILRSGFCIFHDKNYLKEDKDNHKELMLLITGSVSQNVNNRSRTS